MTRSEENVQCSGECREWFDPDDLDVMGLCEPCGDFYYGDSEYEDDLEYDEDADF